MWRAIAWPPVSRGRRYSSSFAYNKDYYAELGVRQDASHDDIKRAFRELSKQHHPDKTSSAVDAKAAHDRYVRISEAYAVLGNRLTRREYDSRYRMPTMPPPRPGSSAGYDYPGGYAGRPGRPFAPHVEHSGSRSFVITILACGVLVSLALYKAQVDMERRRGSMAALTFTDGEGNVAPVNTGPLAHVHTRRDFHAYLKRRRQERAAAARARAEQDGGPPD